MINKEDSNISISLCGDIFISKRLPSKSYAGFDELQKILLQHECRFANLETTIHNNEGYPEAFPGGGYAMAEPGCLSDLKRVGFNLFNTANNHAMDYGHKGLLATIKNLMNLDIPFAGTGINLAEACKPVFFESSNGRIALLGVTSSFHDSYAAGPQNQDMHGRPGVSPLKHRTIYELKKSDYEVLLKISKDIGINNYYEQAIKEGYLTGNDYFKFGTYEFKQGMINRSYTTPDQNDLQRTIDLITDVKYQSDVIIVSVHSHQFANSKECPPEFIKIFVHKCIDAGADIVVCHGPHVLRGIEVYGSGIIFYGLGNFIFQHEHVNCLPEEFYRKYGKTRETVTGVGEIMNTRNKNGTIGLCTSPEVWKSMIVSIICNLRRLEIRLYPVEIMLMGKRGLKGLPILSTDMSIIEEVRRMSVDFNTDIEITKSNFSFISVNKL